MRMISLWHLVIIKEFGMISINGLNLTGPLVLAPMAGYTDSIFRRIARRHGAALTFTELISAEGIVRNNKKTIKLWDFTDEERPLGIQIFGKKADVMAEAARVVESLGPELIDINMGCCARKVCRSGMGAALLRNPAELGRIASSVVRAVDLPVSAKIRIGWDYSEINYREVTTALEDAGIAFVSVHGRTKSQMYTGSADWRIISEIAGYSKIPVIGNGDITCHREALERLGTSGCAAVMIGRGAVGNPWIFNGTSPAFEEMVSLVKEHLAMMTDYYGKKGVILMRKYLVKYIHGFPNAAKFRVSLLRAEEAVDIGNILDGLVKDNEKNYV